MKLEQQVPIEIIANPHQRIHGTRMTISYTDNINQPQQQVRKKPALVLSLPLITRNHINFFSGQMSLIGFERMRKIRVKCKWKKKKWRDRLVAHLEAIVVFVAFTGGHNCRNAPNEQ